MKLTQNVLDLMFELSCIEGESHSMYLSDEGSGLRENLLELFQRTSNPESHEIIIDIMSEAGYPWFGSLFKMGDSYICDTEVASLVSSNKRSQLMSDDDFMELIPANGHFH